MVPIKQAAILLNGQLFIGHRHHDCIRLMREAGVPKGGIQGFVDENGDFWNRTEALEIAKTFNQIVQKHGSPRQLYSEDLY